VDIASAVDQTLTHLQEGRLTKSFCVRYPGKVREESGEEGGEESGEESGEERGAERGGKERKGGGRRRE
jgi:hypothetical protein